MKKWVLFAGILAAAVLLSACANSAGQTESGELSKKVALEAEKTAYKAGTEEISCTVRNNSAEEIVFGEGYTLEKKDADAWKEVPSKGEMQNDFLYRVSPGEEKDRTFAFSGRYDSLDAGDYRISMEVSGTETKQTANVYFSFTMA